MIDRNKFKFGYGDISIDSNPTAREMCFRQFKPPVKCGDYINSNDVEWIGEQILIKVGYEDYQELHRLLSRVKSREISEFTFKNYIFDFTNYNEKSVVACEQKLNEAMRLYFLAMAC